MPMKCPEIKRKIVGDERLGGLLSFYRRAAIDPHVSRERSLLTLFQDGDRRLVRLYHTFGQEFFWHLLEDGFSCDFPEPPHHVVHG